MTLYIIHPNPSSSSRHILPTFIIKNLPVAKAVNAAPLDTDRSLNRPHIQSSISRRTKQTPHNVKIWSTAAPIMAPFSATEITFIFMYLKRNSFKLTINNCMYIVKVKMHRIKFTHPPPPFPNLPTLTNRQIRFFIHIFYFA